MANLKEIRNRIASVSSTMQITSAMKMVSAAKLKKAQDAITAMRPYSEKLTELLQNLSATLDGKIREVYAELENYINRYTGENIVSKFELLKAYVTGRLLGVDEYKKTLNFVALTYPNSAEGKQAEVMLQKDIPMLERLDFGQASMSWKIIFKFDSPNDPKIKPLSDKILKFIKEGLNNSITLSNDIYTLNENLLVIHGFNSKLAAEDAVSILKDYKKYKVAETPIIISAEDYKVVQIKKNLSQYLSIK
jgi:molybdopterin converting factor small subunit